MTFKKFSIFLISFVFIFISIRFYSFVEDYSSWQYADWLINYQGGFVRRGLFGEIFFNIYKLFSLRLDLIIFLFVIFLYLVFSYYLIKSLKYLEISKLNILIILSPGFFLYPMMNSEVIGRKDILLITTISYLIFLFDKIKIPAALLSGTLVASGIFQITDIASYKLPDETINFCLLILGASVGCRFAEKTIKEVARNTLHSLIATFLLVILGLIAAYIATFFVNNNFLTLILSFCPGGIYEVAVIAIAFDLDPNFVSFHHIIRLLIILFIIPVILKLIDRKKI